MATPTNTNTSDSSNLLLTSSKKRIYVFDSPRTCSLLFAKLFEAHPRLEQIWFPCAAAAAFGPDRIDTQLQKNPKADDALSKLSKKIGGSDETYDAAWKRLSATMGRAEAHGKIPWIKEHTMFSLQSEILLSLIRGGGGEVDRRTNPTRYPDDFFWSLTPIFLIRHPALSIPSYFKQQKEALHLEASDECFAVFTTQSFTRLVFDVFKLKTEAGKAPLVVDAKELIHETMLTMEKLCELLALDPNGVQYNWSPVPPDQWPNMPMAELGMLFFTDLWRSGRVYGSGEKALEDTLNLDDETQKWADEFGEETAKHLRRLVDADMPHYEYMKQFKVTAF